MNVHHLELFYYVARHEGITAAVRNMPYGIQQPAVSGQLLQLEKQLGVTLFHRRPFALTEAGEKLYGFIEPFFTGLKEVEEKLTGGDQKHLRLAASAVVLNNHIPVILEALRKEVPDLRLTLRDFLAGGMEDALLREEIDLAISVLPEQSAPGIKTEFLIELPLVMLVPPGGEMELSKLIPDAAASNRIEAPLVALPEHEPLTRLFLDGLERHGLIWPTTIEVNSVELVTSYVSKGYGYGLMPDIPRVDQPGEVGIMNLPDFPTMKIGILHRGHLKPLAQRFVEFAHVLAERIAS